ncbi:hypothetical protein [Liquorilactobacillus vini]|uniref:Uncharacterized protein n=1 Tax=Liquorilactobacillus vini DSM 20605 TaxID=1133569 RepID=A0A0R2CDF5_9LACO|nr:hypothetical protein [Liquorilactobacillus vini]KRM86411.1 hypothetical protein FD21_GL001534 [Liquorilactobacillus vini DSM 20605]
MKKRIMILLISSSLLALTAVGYFVSGWYLKSALNSQMNSLLASHNAVKLASLAANNSTLKFLEHAPANAKVKDTSDAQGGSAKRLYYVTQIDQQNIGVYLKKIGFLTWKIAEIVK